MLLLMRWTCSSLSFKVMIDWRSGRESSAWRILGTRFSFQPIVAKCWSVLTYCGCRVNYIQHRYQFMFTTTTHCIHYHLLLFTFSYHPLSLRNCICCFIFCYHSIVSIICLYIVNWLILHISCWLDKGYKRKATNCLKPLFAYSGEMIRSSTAEAVFTPPRAQGAALIGSRLTVF